ncbi:MAG: hypothetical protein EB127_15485 [Alphaproteobacteria bacterium]|nr:hypothetical protein [Alphaproteobacteria bacterium]
MQERDADEDSSSHSFDEDEDSSLSFDGQCSARIDSAIEWDEDEDLKQWQKLQDLKNKYDDHSKNLHKPGCSDIRTQYYKGLANTEGWWGFEPDILKGYNILKEIAKVPDNAGFADLALSHIYCLHHERKISDLNELMLKKFAKRLQERSTKCPNSALAYWLIQDKISDFTLDNLERIYPDYELDMEVMYFLKYKHQNIDPQDAIGIPTKDLLFPPTLMLFTGRTNYDEPIYDELLCIRPKGQIGRNSHYPNCLYTTGFLDYHDTDFVHTKDGGNWIARCYDYIRWAMYFKKFPSIYPHNYVWEFSLHDAMRMLNSLARRRAKPTVLVPIFCQVKNWVRDSSALHNATDEDKTLFIKIDKWFMSMVRAMKNALHTGALCMLRWNVDKNIRIMISKMVYNHMPWDADLWDATLNSTEKINRDDFNIKEPIDIEGLFQDDD